MPAATALPVIKTMRAVVVAAFTARTVGSPPSAKAEARQHVLTLRASE